MISNLPRLGVVPILVLPDTCGKNILTKLMGGERTSIVASGHFQIKNKYLELC
jgi:hypothetical protein